LYCSFGAAFPTFYRLVGPYKSDKAAGIVRTELWDTIKRRGVVGNVFMGVIPMVSGSECGVVKRMWQWSWSPVGLSLRVRWW
jgi:dimethylaniline monooxygenase (N-oxide forming)